MSRHRAGVDAWARQRRSDQLGAVVASIVLIAVVTVATWGALGAMLP
ncbi:hypothetical protein [Haloechinothrix salitolerans]|uniref:Uncharacterized protein n=1 Tax=Haloechinothrix salitolerans TaxID=926830 RepID=A0ABW2BV60_9PSEU